MAYTLLTRGPVHTVAQNTVCALPSGKVNKVRSNGAIESSVDGTNFAAVTLANNEAEVTAPFIRPTAGGDTLIVVGGF
jgi:hypothetical protein